MKIDSVKWANVKIDGQDFWQVLVIGNKLIPREVDKVKQEYGTDHVIANWEKDLLLSGKPEVVLVVNGWSGFLKVSEDFKKRVEKAKAELRVVVTPKAVKEYNRLAQEGKKVNALIHTTC